MLAKKIKDLKVRKLFFKNERKKKLSKFFFIHLLSRSNVKSLPLKIVLLKLQYKTKKLSKIQIKNRCAFTNRAKGVNSFYSLSRIVLRDFMQFGIVPGYIKAVW